MKKIFTIALLCMFTSVLVLTACSTASKHEPAPAVYAPKADRN